MDDQIEYDFEAVFKFASDLIPGLCRSEGMAAIGLRRAGVLVAGVLYERINRHNLWMHVAITPGARLTRRALQVAFAYPFLVCGVERVTGCVHESNAAARRFDEHLGFVEEARLKGAGQDGSDLIIYVMWRRSCKYVPVAQD